MCTNCAVGYYSSGVGASSCTVCGAGMSCNTNSSQPCSAGTFGVEGEMSCRPCPSGQYSESGASNCSVCPGGKDCNSSVGVPSECLAGQYSVQGDAGCTNCPTGIHCTHRESCMCIGVVLGLNIYAC